MLASVLASFSATLSFAAQQGTLGPTATASVDVNLIMGTSVRIAGFQDLPLGVWSGTGDLAANDDLCIGRTGAPLFGLGGYRILASGDGEPGDPAAFTLTDGTRFISYDAYFNDQTGITGRQQLTPGVALTGQGGLGLWMISNYLFGCVANNANVSIVVREAQLRGASGNYAGTLRLTLIPE